jgi:hypothetical protein
MKRRSPVETSKEELEVKLGHILHDIKDLQRAIIRIKLEDKEDREHTRSKWELLGKEISSKWAGPTAVEEIRGQREKKW